ncbi:low-complexity tail membrane protein [Oscillatoria salina]|uniref:low-complexity tail membrane protein n=1 Tax=Oscillatoria salina TaxID=331517 RepID=UPI0013BA6084|nr:low-complexity tail membrane protein [Oscillatoria salina]MBZ8179272.1 low-complexity tail membrane protein [Oscillatoria salina IIICB1]NET86759.1 low-complexity tail membrane protein [Kamptonema sp. SIO1D9]
MESFKSEPFLWIHLAGLAVLPLALELVWLSLAVGDPVLPFWLELFFLAAIAIVPILVMQWYRPFDIFSILVVSLQPQQLTEKQRKILSLFKTPKHRVFTVVGAILMLLLLWQIYRYAPAAATVALFPPQWRIAALLVAALAFLVSNLFLQVPISVLTVLLTTQAEYEAIEAIAESQIPQQFTVPGFRVRKILPTLQD